MNSVNSLDMPVLGVPQIGTLGVIPALYETLQRAGSKAYLSSHHTPYITTDVNEDHGWGCGYRNIQMMLLPLRVHAAAGQLPYPQLQSQIPSTPDISWIQKEIENGWLAGFDEEGRHRLQGVLSGTEKWLGATEVSVLFSQLGVEYANSISNVFMYVEHIFLISHNLLDREESIHDC